MAHLTYDERMARRRHLDELKSQITELAAHLQAGTYRLLVLLRDEKSLLQAPRSRAYPAS